MINKVLPQKAKNLRKRLKRRFSAGGVVFRRKAEGFEILLLRWRNYRGKLEWCLPKGTIEETDNKKTALREITEETGLTRLKIRDKLGKFQYFYKESWAEGDLIFKEVIMYLVEAEGEEEIVPQKEEGFVGGGWFSPEEAVQKVSYKNSQAIIRKAIKLIKRLL